METHEAFQLLTLASARDGRTVDGPVAQVWAEDLFDVTLAEGVAAAKEHYRSSSAWLMPSHILDWKRAQRKLALPSTMSPFVEDCGSGNHRWQVDGTCRICIVKKKENE